MFVFKKLISFTRHINRQLCLTAEHANSGEVHKIEKCYLLHDYRVRLHTEERLIKLRKMR
jgi:hypothetical protein